MARPHGFIAAAYARRKTDSHLPGDIFGSDLQDLRCVRLGSGRRDRLPRSWCWRLVEAAMAAKEVPAGQSWVFRDHRTMAEVIAAEAG